METLFLMTIVLPAFVVGVSALLFGLARFVVVPEPLAGAGRAIRPSQVTLGQMMAAVALAAIVLLFFTAGPGPERVFSTTLVALCVLAWFVRNWRKEFVFLMGLRDEEFPGRHDKLIWVGMLLALAPVGVWVFRAYRLAHWPEPAPAMAPEHRTEEAGGTAAQPA
jgi:hypothetical protein